MYNYIKVLVSTVLLFGVCAAFAMSSVPAAAQCASFNPDIQINYNTLETLPNGMLLTLCPHQRAIINDFTRPATTDKLKFSGMTAPEGINLSLTPNDATMMCDGTKNSCHITPIFSSNWVPIKDALSLSIVSLPTTINILTGVGKANAWVTNNDAVNSVSLTLYAGKYAD